MIRAGRIGLAVMVALLVGAWGLPGVGAAESPAAESPTTASPAAESPSAEPPVVVAATPAITVTPSTNLASGSVVTVNGTGFPVGQTGIIQCRAGVSSINDCDLGAAQYLDTDADGSFVGSFTVRRSIRLGSGTVNCAAAPGTCSIAAGNITDQTQGAAQPISFDPNLPSPTPELTVDPAVDLVSGQEVFITGAGFRPNALLLVQQCVAGQIGCGEIGPPVIVNAAGTFFLNLVVRNRIVTLDGTVNCLVTACEIRAMDLGNSDYDAVAALGFDPDGPAPTIPTITVTPNTDLADRDSVVVTGENFDPSVDLFIQQCPVPTNNCQPAELGFSQTDTSGSFSQTFRVRRQVGRFAGDGVEAVDCAASPCQVVVTQASESTLTATAPVAFDPSVPLPPPPTVTATPTTDLGARQTVTVQGSGFTPGSFVDITRCAFQDNRGFCSSGASAIADEAGNLNASIVVRRLIATSPIGAPTLDCAGPATCSLQVYGDDLLEPVRFPLTFDPNAPAPPPPTVSVDPSTGLGYRQSVTARASGFAAGDDVFLQQCLPDPDPFLTTCSGFAMATADASGNVETPFTVRRTLSNGFEEPTDCAAAPGTCVVTIRSSDSGDTASTPLGFDPNAAIPPPPTLTATPSTTLADGQFVSLAGTGYSPNAPMGFTLCAAGTLSLNRCDIGRAGFATADADGSFTGQLEARSTINTSEGPIDCGAAPGTCEFAAANTSDYIENGRAPASFGPEIGVEGVAVSVRVGSARLGVVKVTLSSPSAREVRVHYATADGSATAPSDYLPANGDLVFAPGQTAKLIWVGIIADGTRNQAEELFVDLSAPQAGSLGTGSRATVTAPRDRDDHHHHGHGHRHHHGHGHGHGHHDGHHHGHHGHGHHHGDRHHRH